MSKFLKKLSFIKHLPKKFWFLGLIILLGTFFFISSKNKKTEPIQTVAVKRQTISSTISASGTLAGKNSVALRFKGGGKLTSLNVSQNDQVSKGQVIASLDTAQLNIALQQARNTLTAKQAAAQKIEDDVKGHDNDETATQKSLRSAAQADSNNAFDSVKAAQQQLQDAILTSPIAGTVISSDVVPGQNVSVSDVIATIVDPSEIYFYAEVDEADLSKIMPDQKVDINLNSYPDKVFTGSVKEISQFTKTTSSGATVVVAKIKLDDQSIRFAQGLNGGANIITDQKQNTLTIPQESLRDDNTVYIKDGPNYKSVPIKTGLKSDTDVEILEGLTDNQQVVTNPQAVKVKK